MLRQYLYFSFDVCVCVFTKDIYVYLLERWIRHQSFSSVTCVFEELWSAGEFWIFGNINYIRAKAENYTSSTAHELIVSHIPLNVH